LSQLFDLDGQHRAAKRLDRCNDPLSFHIGMIHVILEQRGYRLLYRLNRPRGHLDRFLLTIRSQNVLNDGLLVIEDGAEDFWLDDPGRITVAGYEIGDDITVVDDLAVLQVEVSPEVECVRSLRPSLKIEKHTARLWP